MTPCYNGCVDTKHLCCAGGKGDLRGMEETERRTESITVRLISKEQFCKIIDAIHEQDKLMDSICKSLERIADIFSFDVDNRYRKALEDLLVYLFDDINKAEVNRWNKHMIIFRYVDLSELKKLTNAL